MSRPAPTTSRRPACGTDVSGVMRPDCQTTCASSSNAAAAVSLNLDATLSQELLEVTVRQPEPQIPAHRQQGHLRRKPEQRRTLSPAESADHTGGASPHQPRRSRRGQPQRNGPHPRPTGAAGPARRTTPAPSPPLIRLGSASGAPASGHGRFAPQPSDSADQLEGRCQLYPDGRTGGLRVAA